MKPIPPDRPAKLLGEKLREIKGDISYHRMGKTAMFKHNKFSTTADGTYRGWHSVQHFLDAVVKCGGTVTEDDVKDCRLLHTLAQKLYEQQRQTGETPVETPTPAALLTVISSATEVGGDMSAPSGSMAEAPLRACPPSMARATTLDLVVGSLVDLVMDSRFDLGLWRTARADGVSRPSREGTAEWEVLTGRRPPTLDVVLSIVKQCGGGPADLARWEHLWHQTVTVHEQRDALTASNTRRGEESTLSPTPAAEQLPPPEATDGGPREKLPPPAAPRRRIWILSFLRRRKPSSGASDSS